MRSITRPMGTASSIGNTANKAISVPTVKGDACSDSAYSAVVTRAAPSLNIFAVGFPAMTLGGFLILIISMESIGVRIEWLWLQGFNVLREVMGVSRG